MTASQYPDKIGQTIITIKKITVLSINLLDPTFRLH